MAYDFMTVPFKVKGNPYAQSTRHRPSASQSLTQFEVSVSCLSFLYIKICDTSKPFVGLVCLANAVRQLKHTDWGILQDDC